MKKQDKRKEKNIHEDEMSSNKKKNNSKQKEIKKDKEKKQKKKKITISNKEYDELKEQQKKAEEYHDRMLRLSADYENAKKRLSKEKEGYINFANEKLVSNLLPIIDDFERGIKSAEDGNDLGNVLTGIKLIKNQIYSLLNDNGLEKIEPENKKFDPNLHEAIGYVETDKYPEDNVVEVLQTGYLFKGRLLRPAVVRIAKRTEDRSQKTENRRQP